MGITCTHHFGTLERKVSLYTRATQVLTTEQIEQLSVDEINEVLKTVFKYDDYQYQKDKNILIKEKYHTAAIHMI